MKHICVLTAFLYCQNIAAQSYTSPSVGNASSNNNYYLSNLSLGSINNNSTKNDNPYTYYSGTSTNLTKGTSYTGSISYRGNTYTTISIKIWIDYNNDGDFVDSGEEVYAYTGFDTSSVNVTLPVSFTVPSTYSFTGTTRLRAAIKQSGTPPTPTTLANQRGEFEDYNVSIVSGNTAPTASCKNIHVNLDAGGSVTITPSQVNNGSFDTEDDNNSIALNYSLNQTTFTCNDVGTNNVTLTVTDSGGLTDTCMATVTVSEYEGALTSPSLPTIDAYCNYTANAPVIDFKCDTEITGTTSDPTSFNSQGQYTITWNFYDATTDTLVTSDQIININTPAVPTNVIASSITPNSASIGWDYNENDSFKVRFRVNGTNDSWAEATTSTKTITLNNLDSATEYEVQVKSNQSCATTYTSSITFTTTEVAYCTPSNLDNSAAFFITNVTLETIDNTTVQSTNANQYTYFNNITTDLRIENTYNLVLSYEVPAYNSHQCKVYIDYNNDGDFDEANEEIASFSGSQPAEVYNQSINFTVPSTATVSTTRMRVLLARSDASGCTTTNQSGEAEDYVIQLLPIPTAPTASCVETLNINLDVSGNATITADQINNGSSDSFDLSNELIFSIDKTTFTCEDLGANTVTLTVENTSGLTDTCTATVNVSGYTGAFEAPVLETINAYCAYTVVAPVLNYLCGQEIIGTSNYTEGQTITTNTTITWTFNNGTTNETSEQIINIITPTTPTNLTATNTTKTSATIHWNATVSGPYKIRYKPTANNTWLETSSSTTSVTLTGLNNDTEYEAQVNIDTNNCSEIENPYSSSIVFQTTAINYCTTDVNLSNGGGFYTSQVSIGDISNTTTDDGNFYTYFSGTATTVNAGETFSGSITYQRGTFNTTNIAVWIDFDQNGVFNDATEKVYSNSTEGNSTTTITETLTNISIPVDATEGKTRMRIGVIKNNSQPNSACDFNNSQGEIEDYDFFIGPRDLTDFESAIITQIYHNSTTERWIEITNNSATTIAANTIILALYKNTSGAQPGVTPTATYIIGTSLNAGQSAIIKSSNSTIGNLQETPLVADAITDFDGANDILIVTSVAGTTSWENRFDVISGFNNNTAYVRNDNVNTYNSTFTSNEWTVFVDDALNPYEELAAGGPQRHPNAPIRSEIDNANATSNIRLGVHNFGSTNRISGAWDNGFPDKTRTTNIQEDYTYDSGTFSTKNLTLATNTRLTITDNPVIILDALTLNSGAELRLAGTAQLIQTHTSSDKINGTGKLYIDQNSTVPSKFRFNYFSSPVTTNGSTFTVADVMKDGTTPTSENSTPAAINFILGSDGANTTPISIAEEWIYTYASNEVDVSNFEQKFATGTINKTDGFTFKGPGVAQNYTFVGTPNDGTFTTSVGGLETYLVGNPYPSAMSIKKFIEDNVNSIDGTLYFWEHVGEDNTGDRGHEYAGYIGGYATRNITMGLSADQYTENDTGADTPHVGNGAYQEPKPYIAVAQGFFVSGDADGGTITFNNSQREYITEGTNSVFFKANKPTALPSSQTISQEELNQTPMLKIGLDFVSENGDDLHRQIGITFHNKNTFAYEPGYDAISYNEGPTDIAWKFDGDTNKYVIVGVPSIHNKMQIPLQLEVGYTGTVHIDIDEWQNVNREVFLLDKQTQKSYSLTNGKATLQLAPNTYIKRFAITFGESENLSIPAQEAKNILISSHQKNIKIQNFSTLQLQEIELYNLVGQKVYQWNVNPTTEDEIYLDCSQITSGVYVLKIRTLKGILNKKMYLK